LTQRTKSESVSSHHEMRDAASDPRVLR